MTRYCHIRFLSVIASLALVVACAAGPRRHGVVQTFDESTGAMTVALDKPIVLAAEVPQIAVNARDYVYLGPVEVGSGGEKRHYLWIGQWSSIDRQLPDGQPDDGTEGLYLRLDGEPMELTQPLGAERMPRAGQSPYDTPVASANEQLYLLTKAQLIRIAQANDLSIDSARADGVRRYRNWRIEYESLKIFAAYLETGDTAHLRVARYD